ncbi:MAG: flagellar basal body protein [Terricaulis sp.]
MALIADDAADRVEQLLLLTERLGILVKEETRLIDAREPPLDGALGEEKARLANAYRLELARIKQERSLIEGAPPHKLSQLRRQTEALQLILAAHETSLAAVKMIAEGLAQAMAEEVSRQLGGPRNYGASGGVAASGGPIPVALDRKA